MSENKTPQAKESFIHKMLSRLPKQAVVNQFAGKVDTMMVPYYAIAVALGMYILGTAFVRFQPTNIEQAAIQTALFSGFVLVSFAIVALASFESLRRNELGDFVRMLISIGVSYAVVTSTNNWVYIMLAYGFGFSLTHSAARRGQLDWTPIVGFNAAYLAFASNTFGYTGVSIMFPMIMMVVFEIAEVLRSSNFPAIRLALPGLAVSMIGVIFTTNPTYWILAGGIISFVVVPTILRLRDGNSRWLSSSEQPCKDWQNGVKNLSLNVEAATLTMVVGLMVTVATLVIGW